MPMKKLILLLLLSSIHSLINAQGVGGIRWYDQYALLDHYYYNGALSKHAFHLPIWEDSTVLQRTDTGLAPVSYSAYYHVIDPIRSTFFNDPMFVYDTYIGYGDDFLVDSIAIFGNYIRMQNRPDTVVDTLIISAAFIIPHPYRYYNAPHISKTQQPNIAWYTAKDSIFAYAPYFVDTQNHALLTDTLSKHKQVVTLKIPLTAADGDTMVNGALPPPRIFIYPLVLQQVRGEMIAISVSFRSGDVWTKNVTEIDSMHRFMPIVSYARPDTAMDYFYDIAEEATTSGFMLTSDDTRFIPSLFLEANSSPKFKEEYVWAAAHIICLTCTVSVKDRSYRSYNDISAYPNPSSDKVNFSLSKKDHKTYTLTIYNTLGKTVAIMPITDNTSWDAINYPKGVYYYQLSDEGVRITYGRILIL